MKHILFFTLLLSALWINNSTAQEALLFTRDGKKLEVRNTANNTLVELFKADSTFNFNVAAASFPAGKKLDWQYHPGGQVLVITEGKGYYQEKGKPKRTVQKGEVITCQPGVEHWHGSSVEAGVTYLAVSPAQKGPTFWLQKVTDEEYQSKN